MLALDIKKPLTISRERNMPQKPVTVKITLDTSRAIKESDRLARALRMKKTSYVQRKLQSFFTKLVYKYLATSINLPSCQCNGREI
jgi:hypothetical protein